MPDPVSTNRPHVGRVIAAKVGADVGAALLSAVLLSLSFAPFGQFYLAWVALVPLLWRLHLVRRAVHAAAIGLLCGLCFFGISFHWLFYATTGGYVIVCIIMSLYWMLNAIIIHRFRTLGPVTYTIAVALLWAGTEYLRGTVLGGFPWLNVGHTQSPVLLMCQIADVTGVAGITAWVVMLNAVALRAIVEKRRSIPLAILPVAVMGLVAGYGVRSTMRIDSDAKTVRIALVQSNHIHTPDGAKTVTQEEQIAYLLEHSKAIQNVDIIAWPETTMPPLNVEARTEPGLGGAPLFNRTLDHLSALARDRDAAIVTGGYFVGGFQGELGKRKATDIRNSVYVISRDGQLAGRYDKIRLVPFAEYIPFQESENALHRVMTKFATASYAAGYRLTPADNRTVFETATPSDYKARIITPICFEDTIAPLVRTFVNPVDGTSKKRADVILNISNDGWFNRYEKAQHLQIALFRSIENRVPTARVSNTGQSAFIDSAGRITQQLDTFVEGVLVGSARIDPRLTIYTRFGEVFAWLCIVTSATMVGVTFRPAPNKTTSSANPLPVRRERAG